ncbi:hypothetical protein SAY87_030087 [Trapa incisa]|uniref:Uncharacterized protein n=1 Tax=Trapa incisa TaxID=236973 RepID=A0AAN7KCX2_9MYRT|nr:hypothetical protein SAY87_030087 [Trapa incisa]
MKLKGTIPNQYTCPSALKSCTSMGALEEGEQIQAHHAKTDFHWNPPTSILLAMPMDVIKRAIEECPHGRVGDKSCRLVSVSEWINDQVIRFNEGYEEAERSDSHCLCDCEW